MDNNRNTKAVKVVSRVIEERDWRKGKFHADSIGAYHFLPILLNRVKLYKEAVTASKEAIERESRRYLKLDVIVNRTKT